MSKYRVIGDRVLVKRDDELENPAATILMTDDLKQPPRRGEVLAVGTEVKYTAVGDRVQFSQYAGHFLETTQGLAESSLIVMREDEILAIEDEDAETA